LQKTSTCHIDPANTLDSFNNYSGKIFTIRGRGVPFLRRKERGNQLVIINVAIPTKLTKEQRELFEKLAESLGTTVQPQQKGFIDWLNEALGG